MIKTTNDKKVIENTNKKSFKDAEYLSALVFKDKKEIEVITSKFGLFEGFKLVKSLIVDKGGDAMVELIIKSKIKSAVPNMAVAGEIAEALNKKVLKLLEEGAVRAKANGRRTLQARDL